MEPIDFAPTTSALAGLVRRVRPDQLVLRTPCPQYSVADLLDHIGGLSMAFTCAARKEPVPGGGDPSGSGARLPQGWRRTFPERLEALAAAWADPTAYVGMTMAGPVEMPAEAGRATMRPAWSGET